MLSQSLQWQAFRTAWLRLICPCPVLVVISHQSLLCSWRNGRQACFRAVALPEGVCRDGLPQQSDALAECLADLVFDLELPGAELVLSLPPVAAAWSVVDGVNADSSDAIRRIRERVCNSDLPFHPDQSYLAASPLPNGVALAAVPRASLCAWVDVVERADLPLRRIGWTLFEALRVVLQLNKEWHGDLAWLLVQQEGVRLILIRDQIPEVDHQWSSREVDGCCVEIRALLRSWQSSLAGSRPLGWWLTLDDTSTSDWLGLVDADLDEHCLNRPIPWLPEPWNDLSTPEMLPPLAHLALMSLHEQESWSHQ